ncbi:thiamine pyrophosphate-binding protein [uncultured Methanobrevibacter sp.]|uniref:thiamine pyrophosphate-binding protein n=1 Tax=uncultured Methanobrevibacter sp. TaxID=253161 RepID=UPI002628A17A
MNTAEILIKMLEADGVEYIFGHPGEQVLPFYKVLKDSSIKHILTRHEQAAVHAADAYARSLGVYGLSIATAGPGAMNMVMGVSTAFKDSVPLLVITGDNDFDADSETFQSFPINEVFKPISLKSYHPDSLRQAVSDLREALHILNNYPKGPVHINLSKNVLLEELDDGISVSNLLESLSSEDLDNNMSDDNVFDNGNLSFENGFSVKFDDFYETSSDYVDANIDLIVNKLHNAEKPLLLVGNGVVWGKAIEKLKAFVSKTHIPIVTTYHSKGILDEGDNFNLGIVGLRGAPISDYAYLNSDCILVLGARLSERTIAVSNFDEIREKMIHVNIDRTCLKGKINICNDVSVLLDLLLDDSIFEFDNYSVGQNDLWLDEIYSHDDEVFIDGISEERENYESLRPPYAINKIVDKFMGSYFLSDAGTHTTWTTLLCRNDKFGKLLFSGGFGPMGYGLSASIGVAIAHPDSNIVVICGDGDIQMVIQELATIKEYGLNVSIFVINNSQLGIIRQWEETIYDFEKYEVDLNNPDFNKLAEAYGIDSMEVNSKEELLEAIDNAFNSSHAFLADVHVLEENIPLAKK